jgi:hypothetical protein
LPIVLLLRTDSSISKLPMYLFFWCLMFWPLYIFWILILCMINWCKDFFPFCDLSLHSGCSSLCCTEIF